MKLKPEDQDLIRKYVAVVDFLIGKYVPPTVAGENMYNKMITYLDLRKKISHLFSAKDWEKTSKWRQIDLEEAIANEKSGK